MAEEITKQSPGGAPIAPGGLAARIGPAGVAPEDPSGIRIRLEVVGGHADERYEFRFEADGAGSATLHMVDRIRKVEKSRREEKLAKDDVARIVKSLDAGRLAEMTRGPQPIPPDSVVGRLTVAGGGEEVSVIFMADREQAEAAGVRLDPAVAEAVEEIYRLAGRRLGVKDIRP
jgi:hypothetical protein